MVLECAADGDLVSHIAKARCLQVEQSQYIFTHGVFCSLMRTALHTATSNCEVGLAIKSPLERSARVMVL